MVYEDEKDSDIISLYEEDGTEVKFEHLDTFELNDNVYVALIEVIENFPDNNDVCIMKVVKTDDGEELFSIIEDDDELEEAYNEFMNRYEEMYFSSDEDE